VRGADKKRKKRKEKKRKENRKDVYDEGFVFCTYLGANKLGITETATCSTDVSSEPASFVIR
jgi:regulator of replication initiation timing